MRRLLDSARTAGIILLALPLTLGVALNLFPNYDARPEYFASSYSSILDGGAAFPVSLLLLILTSLLLGILVVALRHAPQAQESGGMVAMSAGLGVSAVGLLLAALLSVPVWVWAGRVTDKTLTVSDGASISQGLASTSQTLILLFGLGGLVVGLTALGILSYGFGWTPSVVFWATIAAAAATVAGGFALTLFWIALGLPPLLWTLMIGGSLTIRGRYDSRT